MVETWKVQANAHKVVGQASEVAKAEVMEVRKRPSLEVMLGEEALEQEMVMAMEWAVVRHSYLGAAARSPRSRCMACTHSTRHPRRRRRNRHQSQSRKC